MENENDGQKAAKSRSLKDNSGPRMRRSNSGTRVEEETREEAKERALQPDRPCHKVGDSLLSSSSGYQNYRGFFNLCLLLLALSNARLALENVIKYGILVQPFAWISFSIQDPYNWPSTSLTILINIFIIFSFGCEKLLYKGSISERTGFVTHFVNLALMLIFPAVVITIVNPNVVTAFVCLSVYVIVFLKLASYAAVNKWCRDSLKTNRKKRRKSLTNGTHTGSGSTLVKYPDNLNTRDLYYFMAAPTLCYELNFPRTTRIRKRFLIRRLIELFFLIHIIMGLVQQWIVPTINNSIKPFSDMDVSRITERIMKLAIPNHIIWLLGFYWYFHSYLNVTSELLKFGDRLFYNDWWNSESVSYFWANWNIPVYKFSKRHIYSPMLSYGFTKRQAQVAVFFVSAFFHEYIVSVPLHMFRLWAFMGMIMQIPFSMFVSRFLSGQSGNLAVWLSLIIGQPFAVLMYFHDYYVENALASQNSQ